VLKYTFGALAALAIAIAAGFVILVQVSDGGADIGPAPVIIVTLHEDGVLPVTSLTAPVGSVVELQLNNRSAVARTIRLDDDRVEQLPDLADGHDPGSREFRTGIQISAGPGRIGTALVRFKEEGTYDIGVGYTGVLFPPDFVTITVE
jgi:hypothetical protein